MIHYLKELKGGEPEAMQAFHKWATLVWFLAALPICIFLSSSIPFLVFISVYAVVTGHWSAWQSSRVESKQKSDADVQEVLDVVTESASQQSQDASQPNSEDSKS